MSQQEPEAWTKGRLELQKVSEIMTQNPVTVTPTTCLRKAVAVMEKHKIGGMPVIENGRLVGIITSRDIRRSHPNRLVADAMTKKVITVSPDSTLWEAKKLIDHYGIERLVVVEENIPVGIITKSRLFAAIGRYVDSLTGLKMAELMQEKAAELIQEGKEITVIFFDLDDFGMVNKEAGHIVGDQVLQCTAKILSSMVEPEIDYLFRYAGDEFVIVTLRPLLKAKELAIRAVKMMEKAKWPERVRVGISAGLAGGRRYSNRSSDSTTFTISNLINMASLASTRAKKEGRKVVIAGNLVLDEFEEPLSETASEK